MKAAAWTFGKAGRLTTAERGAALSGRVVEAMGRRKLPGGRTAIGRLPWPASLWTDARDLPSPPRQSFRAWWRATDGGRVLQTTPAWENPQIPPTKEQGS